MNLINFEIHMPDENRKGMSEDDVDRLCDAVSDAVTNAVRGVNPKLVVTES